MIMYTSATTLINVWIIEGLYNLGSTVGQFTIKGWNMKKTVSISLSILNRKMNLLQ